MKNIRVGLVHACGFDYVTIPTNLLNQLLDKVSKKEKELVHTISESGSQTTYEVSAIVIGDMAGRVLIGSDSVKE